MFLGAGACSCTLKLYLRDPKELDLDAFVSPCYLRPFSQHAGSLDLHLLSIL